MKEVVTIVFGGDADPRRDHVVTERHAGIVIFPRVPDACVVEDEDAAVLVDDLDHTVEVVNFSSVAEFLELGLGFLVRFAGHGKSVSKYWLIFNTPIGSLTVIFPLLFCVECYFCLVGHATGGVLCEAKQGLC